MPIKHPREPQLLPDLDYPADAIAAFVDGVAGGLDPLLGDEVDAIRAAMALRAKTVFALAHAHGRELAVDELQKKLGITFNT